MPLVPAPFGTELLLKAIASAQTWWEVFPTEETARIPHQPMEDLPLDGERAFPLSGFA